MSKRTLIAIIVLGAFVAFATFGGFVSYKIFLKTESLVQRLQKAEQSIMLMGNHQGNEIAVYQNSIEGPDFHFSEVANKNFEGKWSLFGEQGIGWEADKFSRLRSIAEFNGAIYVGLDGRKEGLAQLWKNSNGNWSKIGGDGVRSSWSDSSEVISLQVFKGNLYAGLDSFEKGATLWRYDGTTWKQIGGDTNGSWSRNDFQKIGALTVHDEKLFVGLSAGTYNISSATKENPGKNLPPAIYTFDGANWFLIRKPSDWQKDYTGIYELFHHSDGNLYAGMTGDASHGDVLRYSDGEWEKIGGDGVNGSWRNPSINWILRFDSFQGYLIALANRVPPVNGKFSTIWAFDGSTWAPIGSNCLPNKLSKLSNINAVEVFEGNLLIGAGGSPAGQASIWRLEKDGCWGLVAGFGKNNSWGSRDGQEYLTYRSATEYIYSMVTIKGDLFVGFGASRGAGQVRRFRPSR